MEHEPIIKIKEKQPWKVEVYSTLCGKEPHSHEVISGANIINGKVVGGETYYSRDINQIVLVNRGENGQSRL